MVATGDPDMPELQPTPEAPSPFDCALLAQRHPDLREGIRGLLGAIFEHVVMVTDASTLLACAARLRPRVVVADLSLGPEIAAGWLSRLRNQCPDLKLVLLSGYAEPAARELAAQAGAVLVLDQQIGTELLPAIDRLLAAAAPATSAPESAPRDAATAGLTP
jgi:DNA-binding NarL/FixJ family response regulator